jgi:hypothetical protein
MVWSVGGKTGRPVMQLVATNQGVRIHFENGSSVSYETNRFGQLVQREYFIKGSVTSELAQTAVLRGGYAVVL